MGPLCSPVNLKAPSPSTTAWRKGPETASTSCLSPHPHPGQEPGLPCWRRCGAIWTPVVPQSLRETVLPQPPRWLNRGCSGAGARNPRLLPAPSACTPNQGPAEGCAGRLPGVGGGGAPQTPRQQRSGPCAPGGRVRAPGHLGIPGSRTCYQSRLARLRGGGNTPPPLRLPAPHGQAPPSRALGPGAPPPGNVCPKNRSLPREPRLGRCRRVKSKAGPGRPGSAGWRRPPKPARNPRAATARVVGRPLHGGSKWIMSPFPLPSRDLKSTSQPFPLGGGGLSPPPLKLFAGSSHSHPQPPFPSSPAAPLSSLPWATAVMVACSPRSPQRLFPSNASPAAPGLKTQLS